MGNNHSSRSNQYPRSAPSRPRANSLPSSSQMIPDMYKSLPEVQGALRKAGLESSNLIVGVDFTKSNTWTGKRTYGGFSLHHISDSPNPYQQVISILGRTLSSFDDDQLLPCYGFGDAKTTDRSVFSFLPHDKAIYTFENVLSTYSQLVPHVQLAGPTTFAPLINKAIDIVYKEKSYHILLIIADGQVTRSVDTPENGFSAHERATVDAIVRASKYPLSIIMIGVGDGPWDQMKWFDDQIPQRDFDNFQFVSFHEVMSSLQGRNSLEKEASFATHALMEIPEQYKAIQKLRLLDGRNLPRPSHPPQVIDPPFAVSSHPQQPAHPPQSQPHPYPPQPQQPYPPPSQPSHPLQMSYQTPQGPPQSGGNAAPPVMSYPGYPQPYSYPPGQYPDPRSSQSGAYPPDPRSSQSGYPPDPRSSQSSYPPGPYPPQSGPYPPQSGPYPPQSGPYPPQSGPYPPQSAPYPPQPGQYPPQGYPPQDVRSSQSQYNYSNPYEKPPPYN